MTYILIIIPLRLPIGGQFLVAGAQPKVTEVPQLFFPHVGGSRNGDAVGLMKYFAKLGHKSCISGFSCPNK